MIRRQGRAEQAMIRNVTGWLFDLYPDSSGVTLWLIDGNGDKHRCHADFIPSFFLHLPQEDIRRAMDLQKQCPARLSFNRTVKRELFSNMELPVLQVNIHNPLLLQKTVNFYSRYFPHFAFYNSDISSAQLYLYETQLFPLAFADFHIDETGMLTGYTLLESREDFEYTIPPMSMMKIRSINDFIPAKYQQQNIFEISYDNRSYVLDQEAPAEVLASLNRHLRLCDPDIILTDYGDSTLLPKISAMARQQNIPMLLNRDSDAGYKISRESSFFQYGKIMHKDGAFELRGRWHIDRQNSFILREANFDGLYEVIRVTQLCPQHQARATIGTGLSSLQLSWAYRNNTLIPAKKREPEEFKSAATLLLADRGGLIFMPPTGYHEDIGELDFVSMYPSIMVNNNISPETINCRCCKNTKVPELGYTICEKREGVVPATLRFVIERRAYYKQKKKEHKGHNQSLFMKYEGRQNALKWMLVCCFGYLGYKNARFGKIEAHESVNAFSRDCILTAKAIAERRGFTLLHAIIDCMWLKKTGTVEADYELLCEEIGSQTGITISLEGIYRWILFPASKVDSGIATGNRYVGAYQHDELKLRGIEARRHDTPIFIKNMQSKMLESMRNARSLPELEKLVPGLLEIVREAVLMLRSGKANPAELVIRRNISKEAGEYLNNSISAVISRMLESAGIHVAAGETVHFIIIDQSGKRNPEKAKPVGLYSLDDGYDSMKYTELVLKAAETLLLPFGYDFKTLGRMFQPNRRRRKRKIEVQYVLFQEAV